MKDMRVEFEAWYNQFGSRFVSDTFKLDADGDYEFEGIQSSWEAWQAALSAVPAQDATEPKLSQRLIDTFQELNMINYGDDDVRQLNDWAIDAYTALTAIAQQPAQDKIFGLDVIVDSSLKPNEFKIVSQQPAQEPQVTPTLTSKINNLGHESGCLVATCNVQDESCELCMSGEGKCLKQPAQEPLQKQLEEITRRHDQQVRINKRLIKAWKDAQQPAQEPVAYRVIASTNGEVVRDSLEFTRMSEIDEKVVRKSYDLQIIPLYVPEIYSRSSLEQFDLDQSKEYNVGRKDGRVIGYEVGYRHATESSRAQQPEQEPVGEVQHYAAPANLPAYVNMKWYGKPPKNGTKLYTTPVKQEPSSNLDRADIALIRQWFNAVQDLNPKYLNEADFQLIAKLNKEPVKQESKAHREPYGYVVKNADGTETFVKSYRN